MRYDLFYVPFLLLLLGTSAYPRPPFEFDIVIYGGSSSGVVAAVQASRMGKKVAIVESTNRLGGMTSNGLGQTDAGHKDLIGGLAHEYYREVAKHYSKASAWQYEDAAGYFADHPHAGTAKPGRAMWNFEPKVAETIFRQWVKSAGIPVFYGQRLDLVQGVAKSRNTIDSITMESRDVFAARVFIDASYEGDLMAAANVSYVVGRESNDEYHETVNGVQPMLSKHQLRPGISPWCLPLDPSSGLLPGIDAEVLRRPGSGDHRVQAYCFRLCLTDQPENRRPIVKPNDYDESLYEILFRNFAAGEDRVPWICSRMPNRKSDINNFTGFSTDYIGHNYEYATANYAVREGIVADHLRYTQGLLWTLANHPRVPQHVRNEVSRWGLCRDEITESEGWPPLLYIREARRMIGDYVMTQHDCEQRTRVADSVGMGTFMMDSHNVQRYVDHKGQVQNEGDVQEWEEMDAYPISYRAIVPKEAECANLLVPVCLSATHIAFGSIRMEPVFMILGQSAGSAAALATEGDGIVQHVDYSQLREQLVRDGQILEK